MRHLIGGRHWLSDGVHKEFLIGDFLARHISREFNISRGFIRKLDCEQVSPEIDLLIADPKRHAPIFFEGGLQIVVPSSVLATIEVKSTYRKKVLREALVNVGKVRHVAVRAGLESTIWSGIMIGTATDGLRLRQVIADVSSILMSKEFWNEVLADSPARAFHECIPNVVSVLDHCVILIDKPSGEDRNINVRGFAGHASSAALAFAQLFSFLRARTTALTEASEMDLLLENAEGLDVFSQSIELGTK